MPVELVVLLQGLIFLSVTAGEFFVVNRVRLAPRVGVSSAPAGGSAAARRPGSDADPQPTPGAARSAATVDVPVEAAG